MYSAAVGGVDFILILINLNLNNRTDTQFSIGKHLSMSGTIWAHESTFAIVNVVKSEYRSNISDENLAAKLTCVVNVNFTPDSKDLV